jgi:hypothetical protein
MNVENYDFAPGARHLNPVSDMYAHVLYEALLHPWSMRMDHGDHLFTRNPSPRSVDEQGRKYGEIPEAVKQLLQPYRVEDKDGVPLDAFAIREAFDRLDPKKPSAVLQFLNAAGEFWYSGSVSLSQIMEWQRFAKLVRREDFMRLAIGILSSDARDMDDRRDAQHALRALQGFPNEFFIHSKPFSDWPPVHPEWPPEEQQSASSAYRESEEHARKKLRAHQMAFLRPQGDALQIEWQYADEQSRKKHSQILAEQQQKIHMGRSQQEREEYWKRLRGDALNEAVMATAPPELARGTFNLKPALVIRVHNVLEAIAAANYIDLVRGVEWKRCALETCKQIFEVKSHHGQQYCDPPSTCKNKAVMLRRRSDPEFAAREKDRARELAAKKKGAIERAAAQERARQKNKAAAKPTKGI